MASGINVSNPALSKYSEKSLQFLWWGLGQIERSGWAYRKVRVGRNLFVKELVIGL